MSALITDIRVLRPEHRHALQLHLLSLSAEDRYQRFGSTQSDAALVHWVRGLVWSKNHWFGAWSAGDTGLVAALQLIPLQGHGVWEMALTVTPVARRLGVGSAMFSALMEQVDMYSIQELVCQNGHPAVRRMAVSSGRVICCQSVEPKLRISVDRGTSRHE